MSTVSLKALLKLSEMRKKGYPVQENQSLSILRCVRWRWRSPWWLTASMVCSRKSRSSLETFLSNHRPRQVCLAALGNDSGVPWLDFGRHKTERAVAGTCKRTNSSGAVVAIRSQKDFSSPVPVEPVAKQVVEGFLLTLVPILLLFLPGKVPQGVGSLGPCGGVR